MQRGESPRLMWAVGLTEQDFQAIKQAAGNDHHLKALRLEDLPASFDHEEEPYIIWISSDAYANMPRDKEVFLNNWEGPQRALVAESGSQLSGF